MRLYSKTGATQVDDPNFGTFKPDATGAFDGLPDAMYADLHGRPGWESEDERALRVAAEELDRFRDPATLLAEVKRMGEGQGALTSLLAQALGLTPPAATPEAAVTPTPAETQVSSDAEAPVETAKAAAPRGRGAKAAKTAVSDAS
jgi:hypothetical protein